MLLYSSSSVHLSRLNYFLKIPLLILIITVLSLACESSQESEDNKELVGGSSGLAGSSVEEGDTSTNANAGTEIDPNRSPFFDIESPQLDIPFDDPSDPRTINSVLGLRRIAGDTPRGIRLYFGPSFDPFTGAENRHSFTIYSPDDPDFAFSLHTVPEEIYVDTYEDSHHIPNSEEQVPRYEVTLFFEKELKEGKRYFVRAIGGFLSGQGDGREMHRGVDVYNGAPTTSGRHAVSFVYPDENAGGVSDELIAQVMGLRKVTQVTDRILKVELGHAINRERISERLFYTLSSEEDSTFSEGIQPDEVGQLSHTERIIPNQREYPYTGRLWQNTVYLHFAEPLSADKTYILRLNEQLASGRTELSFNLGQHGLLNHFVKVNQEGYRPDSQQKWAYVGAWLGTMGTLDMQDLPVTCQVYNEQNEMVVESDLRKRLSSREQSEGAYDSNWAEEEIFVCDFSELEAKGSYKVVVPGWGHSFTFDIDEHIYDRTYHVTMKGLLYQRGGDDTQGTLNIFPKPLGHQKPVDIPYMANRPILGGHHDAGDINPRSRFEIAWLLMEAYQHNPSAFGDGELDIPEQGNDIPDILDEAAWSIRLLIDLQDDDGGVSGNDDSWVTIEHPFDPTYVMPAERDPLIEHAYEKNPKSTFALAALAATASRLWGELGALDEASYYETIAVRAFDWAKANKTGTSNLEHAWAAAELLHLTGDSLYDNEYLNSGYIYGGNYYEEVFYFNHAPAMSYARTRAADSILRLQITDRIVEMGEWFIENADTYGYAHTQAPFSPCNWGTGSYPNGTYPVMFAYMLTEDSKFLKWLEHSASFMLGANALNYTWVTGLGDRPIYETMHLFAWTNYTGIIPPGLQVEGPVDHRSDLARYLSGAVPETSQVPVYHRYYPIRYVPVLNEGVSVNMGLTAAHFALLYADSRR